ncbi:MAG TPA: DUF3501 family protein [Myxococcales bacterium]|nr:DUF3501 family protein [Myxococcales bacterium]
MQPLSPKDLWPLPVYEGVRDQFRKEVIAAKKDRRVTVGPHMTFVFENRTTVKFQVQEILRIERIAEPDLVAEELEGFNGMLPGAGELSATLLVELTGTDAEVKSQLARLFGLKDHVALEVGGARLQGGLDPDREEPGRVSAVQYVRFKVPDAQALLRGPAALVIDHPQYSHRAELSEAVRRSLAQDLT